MRWIIGALAVMLVGSAAGQWAKGWNSQGPGGNVYGGSPDSAPSYRGPYSTYDRQSGNQYFVNPSPFEGGNVQGWKYNPGPYWNSYIRPYGSMIETDPSANYWYYNTPLGRYYRYFRYGSGQMRQPGPRW